MTTDQAANKFAPAKIMANDGKPIFGKNGNFKPSVPANAVRPKPISVPEKAK